MILHWKDAAREETRTTGDKRELMVHLFYPRDTLATGERANYMPDADAMREECDEVRFARISALRSFVIDQLVALDSGNGAFTHRLDLQRGVGVFGHSRGGTTAGTARLFDQGVRGAINLDGTGGHGAFFLAKGLAAGGEQPFMWILRKDPSDENSRPFRALEVVTGGALRVFLNRRGFMHGDFSDSPYWMNSAASSAPKLRAMAEIQEWVRNFFTATVRGDSRGLRGMVSRESASTPNNVTVFGPFWQGRQ